MTASELAVALERGPWGGVAHYSVPGWSVYEDRLLADPRITRLTKLPKRSGDVVETIFVFGAAEFRSLTGAAQGIAALVAGSVRARE